MDQLLAILMVLGDSTVKGKPHPDNSTPLDVADNGLRSSKDLTRYHPSSNDFDEVEPDETSALYSGTQVPGTATLEITCSGESDDLMGASRPKLDVLDSAGQSRELPCGYSEDGQRQTDRLTTVVSAQQTAERPSGKSIGALSATTDERQNATIDSPYPCGKSPFGRLQEHIRRNSVGRQSATTDTGSERRHGQSTTFLGPSCGALKSADDEFLEYDDDDGKFLPRDDRALRQQNASATNRHDERVTVKTADANDRFLTPATIEACQLLNDGFLPRDVTRKVDRKQHMTLDIMTTEIVRTTLMPLCIFTAQRQSRVMTTDFCRTMPTLRYVV